MKIFILVLLITMISTFKVSREHDQLGCQSQKAQIELQKHNQLRAKHHAPPLVLAGWLCQHAQNWADYMVSVNKFQHSDCMQDGKRMGENIYWSSAVPNGGDATGLWYSEIKDYNYSNGQGSWQTTGHFTQVVWKGSQEVGFGYSGGYVVANYYPAGNMMGSFSANVLQP